jgi:transcription initiation factor IIE alpha subunit
MSMHCPLCDEKLEAKDHREAYGEVPAHWLCKACDCRVNLWDDEYVCRIRLKTRQQSWARG